MRAPIRILTAFLVAFLWATLGWSQQPASSRGLADTLQPQQVLDEKPADETLDSELVRAGRNTILLSMLFLMVCFMAFGITIAVAGPFVLFAFTAWGIISTSVIVDLCQRSLSKRFRKLLLLTCSIVGMLESTVGWLILVWRFNLSHAGIVALLAAAGIGLLSGILLGFLSGPIASWLLGSFKRQLFKSND
jgi:hypothetical protein